MTMTCKRCAATGRVDGGLCPRCKGRTVVDGFWEREQLMRDAANKRYQVRLESGAIGRLTFWGHSTDDRAIVKIRNPEGKTITLKLKKATVKEIIK